MACLTSAVSMIQVNLMLGTAGRPPDSLVRLDLMRLPLGVLTGMGFIGAGAILRCGDRVNGLTTAATLWLATTLGQCFGAGQHGLGLAALGLGIAILWALKRLERRLPRERRAELSLRVGDGGPDDGELCGLMASAGYKICDWKVADSRKGDALRRNVRCEVHWQGSEKDPPCPSSSAG